MNKKIKKTKYIIFNYWFHIIGFLIITGVGIGDGALIIDLLITAPNNPTISSAYVALGLIFLGTIFCIFCLGEYGIIWTKIDSEKMVTRGLWRVIKTVRWDNVKNIYTDALEVGSPGGVRLGYFILDDGKPYKPLRGGIVKKHTPMMIRRTKKTEKAIKEFWGKEVKSMYDYNTMFTKH